MASGSRPTDEVHPLCLDVLTVRSLNPLEQVRMAADNGLRLVDLMTQKSPLVDIDYDLKSDKGLRRAAAQACRTYGVEVDTAESFSLAPGVEVEALRPGLEAAAELEARNVLCILRHPSKEGLLEPFMEFCDLAKAYGLKVMLEFSPRMGVKTLDETVQFIRSSGRDAQVVVDCLHHYRVGGATSDLAPHLAMIGRGQISDAPRYMDPALQFDEAVNRRLEPGGGELPLVEWLAALPPGVVVGVEVPWNPERWATLAEHVKASVEGSRALLAQ